MPPNKKRNRPITLRIELSYSQAEAISHQLKEQLRRGSRPIFVGEIKELKKYRGDKKQ